MAISTDSIDLSEGMSKVTVALSVSVITISLMVERSGGQYRRQGECNMSIDC